MNKFKSFSFLRRNFIKKSLASTLIPYLNADLIKDENKLYIPPLLKPLIKNKKKYFTIKAQESYKSFINSLNTQTYGFNSNFLGPTISVDNKDEVEINVKNHLKEELAVHWHGLVIKAKYDGGPHNVIKANDSFTSKMKINQDASTCFYHPHTLHKTGEQTFKGLGGLFIINDEKSKELNLPGEYGIDDIPLIVQDRRFDNKGNFLYINNMHDKMMGVKGNIILSNGTYQAYINAPSKLIRLRLVNLSNARYYIFKLNDNRKFFQIAGDSSLLPKPYLTDKVLLTPAERAEILVDLSKDFNKVLYLQDMATNTNILKINVNKKVKVNNSIPNKLKNLKPINKEELANAKIRKFSLDSKMMRGFTINGELMNILKINEKVKQNELEIWRIKNNTGMFHPMHIHGTTFKILNRNGVSLLNNKLYENEQGLKDTVLLRRGETVDIAVKFKLKTKIPYMYHCHILEHEDTGMMGQFMVT